VTWLIVVLGLPFAVLILACAAALVEVFRHLAEIRLALDLDDESRPLALRSQGSSSETLGLPSLISHEPQAIVLFLSTKCATCLAIVEAFRGGSPATVWFVISRGHEDRALVTELGHSAARVVVDSNDEIAGRLGLVVTPSLVTFEYGRLVRAETVTTPRQVLRRIPTVTPAAGNHAAPAFASLGAQ
jgi:hypothetical protein